MKQRKIFILSGPSGSGKTTLQEMLLSDPHIKEKLEVTVSATTRSPRPGERQGRDYFFLSERMFLYKIRARHFLEYAKIFSHYYGTLNSQVKQIWRQGKNVLLSIDVQGRRAVCRKYPEAVTIFVKTSSTAALRERILKRGSNDPQDIKLRMQVADQEIKESKKYKYILVNDRLDVALRELRAIVLKEIESEETRLSEALR